MAFKFTLTPDKSEATCLYRQKDFEVVVAHYHRTILWGAAYSRQPGLPAGSIPNAKAALIQEYYPDTDTKALRVDMEPANSDLPVQRFWVKVTHVGEFGRWMPFEPGPEQAQDDRFVGCLPMGKAWADRLRVCDPFS